MAPSLLSSPSCSSSKGAKILSFNLGNKRQEQMARCSFSHSKMTTSALHASYNFDDDHESDGYFESRVTKIGVDLDCVAARETNTMHTALQKRLCELRVGIGKRYIVRSLTGDVNVHREPTEYNDKKNIIGSLKDGQIITSIGPNRGHWIHHDGIDKGGWSSAMNCGVVWLEEIQE